jgi:hypothetical protein
VNISQIEKLINERMEREEVGELLNRNTVDDGHGHFITTVIWRTPLRSAPAGVKGKEYRYRETRYHVFVDGKPQSGGGADAEWIDGEEAS